eukprot:scaffold3670_cov124-Cylindrotheca_fusiformis.AAC.20
MDKDQRDKETKIWLEQVQESNSAEYEEEKGGMRHLERRNTSGSSSRIGNENSDERMTIRLDEVQKSTPAESEEENRVMQYLERSNTTGSSARFFDAATSIPEDVASHMSTEVESDSNPDAMTHKRKDTLFDLTNSINLLHEEMHSSPDSSTPVVGDVGKESKVGSPVRIYKAPEKDGSSADHFAANAGKLYERFNFVNRKKSKQKKKVRDGSGDVESQSDSGRNMSTKRLKNIVVHRSLESLHEFQHLVSSKKGYVFRYVRDTFFFIILPSTLLAAILYYFFGNPMIGEDLDFNAVTDYLKSPSAPTAAPYVSGEPTAAPSASGTTVSAGNPNLDCRYGRVQKGPSTSWWILFLGVRQVIILGLARASQFLIMNYALKINFRGMMGPSVRLYLLQARGWPFVMLIWSIYNFAMLYGPRRFALHWMYYQDWVELFNECNPAGSVTTAPVYRQVLGFTIALGILVATKRFWIGMRFGRATYHRYGEKLWEVLNEQLLISKVAKTSQIEYFERLENHDLSQESVLQEWYRAGDDELNESRSGGVSRSPNASPPRRNRLATGSVESAPFLSDAANENIEEMIGAWEDLDIDIDPPIQSEADLSDIIQFRASLSVLESTRPYSPVFGEARTRTEVIKRSEALYNQLLNKQQFLHGNDLMPPEYSILRFHTIAMSAVKSNGSFDRNLCKGLVKTFRPNRNGNITKLEFCKSIDSHYKELRKLRAGIANEGKVNTSSERIMDTLFYFVAGIAGLSIIGIDPIALFGVITSFTVGFAFMIGGASSDYFRGLLFITIQRPYDIGDRVNVSNPESPSSGNGSPGWIVKDINLYHTTFLFGYTMEYATISNGALSTSRIINGARATRPYMNFTMKFGLNVPAETIASFKEQLIAYVKSKPREWNSFAAFRITRIEADQGYVAYIIVVEHRESWQQIGALLDSLGDLQAFAFELSREMKMGYKAPTMPIELKMMDSADERRSSTTESEDAPFMPPTTSFFGR